MRQRRANLLRVIILGKYEILRRIVVGHKDRLGRHKNTGQHARECLHHLVAGTSAQPLVFILQAGDSERDARKAVGEHFAFHIRNEVVAARPVGQIDRLVGEHVIFDDVPQTTEHHRAQTAEDAEDDNDQNRELIDGDFFRHAHAGQHGDIRRAEILVIFVGRLLHADIERVDPLHQTADGLRHALLLILRAFLRRVAERIEDVSIIGRVDLVGRVPGSILHIAGQQLVVGRGLIRFGIPAVLRIIIDIL